MPENNESLSASVKDILDRISGASAKDNEEVAVRGLVFDDSPDGDGTSEPVPNVKFEIAETEERPVVFSVPERFELDSNPETETRPEPSTRIITTYVPRFTEVSDNYRMAKSARKDFVRASVKEKEDVDAHSHEAPFENIDPTAEIEENASADAVTVTLGKSDEEELTQASKVFKFDTGEDEEEVAPEEPRKECEVSEEQAEEVASTDETGPREYKIPDPEENQTALVDYSLQQALGKAVVEEATADMGDAAQFGIGRKKEYTSYSQRDFYKDYFLDSIMSVRVRFFAALAVSLLILLVESMFAFGVNIPRILGLVEIPGAMALLDLQFVICLYLLALPEAVSSIKGLFAKRAAPELLLTLSFSAIIAYTAVMTVYSPRKCTLFGFVFAIFVLSAIGATYFKLTADFTAFKRVAGKDEKSVIDVKYTRALERENAALDGIVEEHKSKIARLFHTLFIPDFFARSEKNSENSKNVLAMIGISLGVSFVVGGVTFFIPGGFDSAATAFTLILMLSYPAMSVLLHKIPFFCASSEADAAGGAIVGEQALIDCSGIDVITFEDTEVFGQEDVTLQRIMLYGHSDNLTKALRQMSALFMNVGGPLDVLFSDALDRKCSPAKLLHIEESGLDGEMEGHKICAGTLGYMISRGISVPTDEKEDSPYESTKVMYAAEDGAVYAKFYIRYSFSEEFSMLVPVLDDEGIKSLVYTRDPNLTPELLISLTAGFDKIRVLKKYDKISPDKVVYRAIGSGIVISGEKSEEIDMILLAKRYSALQNRLSRIQLISMLVGAGLATVLAVGGMSLVPSFALGAWHAIWCVALHILSRKSFRKK